MLAIRFAGWAQCRLATDPDPYDEPRGVSGYLRAYSGEPDLDRIIRFSDPPFVRPYTHPIGVKVKSVELDGIAEARHPLLGASVDLVGDPKLEGRNGVIAEDGDEPIYPFNLRISAGRKSFGRSTVPSDPSSPFREFNSKGIIVDPGYIERETGIKSILDLWEKRLAKLVKDAERASADERPGLEERISFLRLNIESGGGAARFFVARMVWDYELRSEIVSSGKKLDGLLPGFDPTPEPWRATFWFGGWDADAQAFYVSGTLDIPPAGTTFLEAPARRPERMSDIRRL